MSENEPLVHAVYLPPVSGLPYLAVRIEKGQTDAVPFSTPEEASAYNRQRPIQDSTLPLQTVSALYRRLLREALRELAAANGAAAFDDFLERAKLVLTVDVPNIPRCQDELNKQAFEDVQSDVDRARANPNPNQRRYDDNEPYEGPPRRSG
jgi:hypothetical protein